MYSRNGESLKFLAIGDVVSSQGCDYLRDNLPKLKREYAKERTAYFYERRRCYHSGQSFAQAA